MNETTERRVTLTGLAQVAEIREASFQGRRHLVVPVVALVGDSVVRPLGSDGPEFVPLAVLSVAPGGWNGRPVLPNHPRSIDGTEAASANVPRTLELYGFGQCFNSRVEDGRLKLDAWLDTGKAESVGLDASRVVERCMAKELVEVSVGALVVAERRTGTFRGQAYGWAWTSVIPDHLAMLPEGTEGACNAARGCGAPRAAQAAAETGSISDTDEFVPTPQETAMSMTNPEPASPPATGPAPAAVPEIVESPIPPATKARNAAATIPANALAARFRAALRAILPKAMADAAVGSDPEEAAELIQYEAIRLGLTQAGDSVTAAQVAIDALINAETTEPTETPEQEGAEETVEMARLKAISSFCMSAVSSLYTVASSCYSMCYDMEHANDAEDPTVIVVVETGYSAEKVRALAGARHSKKDRETIQGVHDMTVDLGAACTTEKDNALAQPAACGCGKETDMAPAPAATVDRAAVINRLLGLATSPFKVNAAANEATNRATLDALSDDVLTALDKSLAAAPAAEAVIVAIPAVTPATAAEPAPIITLEAALAAHPVLKALVDERAAKIQARRALLTANVSKARPDRWPTPDKLSAKTDAELEDLAAMLPPAQAPSNVDFALLGVPGGDFPTEAENIYEHPPTPMLDTINAQLKAQGKPAITTN